MVAGLTVAARVEHAPDDVWWALSTAAGLNCWQGERVRPILSGTGNSGFHLEWPSIGASMTLEVCAAQAPCQIEFQSEAERTAIQVGEGQVSITYQGLAAASDPEGLRASWRRALWQLDFALQFGRPRVSSYHRAVLAQGAELPARLDERAQELEWLKSLLSTRKRGAPQESFCVPGRELVVADPDEASFVSVRSLPGPGGAERLVLLGWTGFRGQGCECQQGVDAAARALAELSSGRLLPAPQSC